MAKMADEIKVRHYSRKTLKTYALWSRQFHRFLKNKPPQELTTQDVKGARWVRLAELLYS